MQRKTNGETVPKLKSRLQVHLKHRQSNLIFLFQLLITVLKLCMAHVRLNMLHRSRRERRDQTEKIVCNKLEEYTCELVHALRSHVEDALKYTWHPTTELDPSACRRLP